MIEREVIEFVAAADWTDDCRVRVELKKRVTKLTIAEAKAFRSELDAAIVEAERGADLLRRDVEPFGFDTAHAADGLESVEGTPGAGGVVEAATRRARDATKVVP